MMNHNDEVPTRRQVWQVQRIGLWLIPIGILIFFNTRFTPLYLDVGGASVPLRFIVLGILLMLGVFATVRLFRKANSLAKVP